MSLTKAFTPLHSTPRTPSWNISAAPVTENRSGQLTSSPWEGLYLEQNQAEADPARNSSRDSGPELGTFLSTLMYGE
jgi:hypothetical protein